MTRYPNRSRSFNDARQVELVDLDGQLNLTAIEGSSTMVLLITLALFSSRTG